MNKVLVLIVSTFFNVSSFALAGAKLECHPDNPAEKDKAIYISFVSDEMSYVTLDKAYFWNGTALQPLSDRQWEGDSPEDSYKEGFTLVHDETNTYFDITRSRGDDYFDGTCFEPHPRNPNVIEPSRRYHLLSCKRVSQFARKIP